jgi:hypothetical protein
MLNGDFYQSLGILKLSPRAEIYIQVEKELADAVAEGLDQGL